VKPLNHTAPDDHHCHICDDLGWVELKGTTQQYGVTYSRGSAPCKWCEKGERYYERALAAPKDKHDHHKPWRPESDFTLDDVHLPEVDDEPLPKHLAKELIAGVLSKMKTVEEGPPPDLEQAARVSFKRWLDAIGWDMAEQKIRRHYPDQAEPILIEALALKETSDQ